ncbi:efflux RND transporter periplasmic adaptor subunit [Nitrospina gracilis]|uniref:efflux RND transporter periplasmic adaptor subunit n=1 Tax=Nitrospina gracilis TaxID=35801 RepID=UPI001F353389|nr:HlyD family efflux transporter periplasmic adaptor subunit [Nitrospina gracilis]MCF8719867.1 HlyD family secretion protein [Nitrospina gracilis Nb-211]
MSDDSQKPGRWVSLLFLGAVLGGVLFISACPQPESEEVRPQRRELQLPVQVGKVIIKDVVDEIRTVGNIAAEQRVIITAEVEGRVRRLPVEEGQTLRAGSVIASIDSRQYELEVRRLEAEQAKARKEYEKTLTGARPEDKEKLEAQLKADESALELAIKEESRFRKLVADGVVPQSSLDEAVDRVQRARESLRASQAALKAGTRSRDEDILQAKSNLDSVTQQLRLAKLDLSKTKILAPFDGVVIAKRIEVGAFASPGTAVIEMIGSSRLKAVLELPQSYRNKLQHISSAEFHVVDLGLRFQLNHNLRNTVRVIPDANIFSGNIQVQIDLPDANPALFPGLTLEAKIRFDTRKNVKHVPAISLVIGEQGTVVYVVEEGKAKLVPVRAFKEHEGLVEIDDFTHQLTPQVNLIMRGSGAVFPGAKVLITNPEPKAEPPFNSAETNKAPKPSQDSET